MTQEQQDKQAFFAQYWGQEVYRIEGWNRNLMVDSGKFAIGEERYFDKSHLELTPLSAITDQDAIEVGKILHGRDCVPEICYNDGEQITLSPYGRPAYGWNEININSNGFLSYDRSDSLKVLQAYDYLRSRGYLLPFRQYSRQQLLDMGWAKIKEG